MTRRRAEALAVVLLFAVVIALIAQSLTADAHLKRAQPAGIRLIHQVDHARRATWRCQSLLAERATRSVFSERRTSSVAYRGWVRDLWQDRQRRCDATVRRLLAGTSWAAAWGWYLRADTQCVVDHEGGWDSVDLATGRTYFGRFQADTAFQQAYGRAFYDRWGPANQWPPWAQIVMAYRGWLDRGWHPWPTYHRFCA